MDQWRSLRNDPKRWSKNQYPIWRGPEVEKTCWQAKITKKLTHLNTLLDIEKFYWSIVENYQLYKIERPVFQYQILIHSWAKYWIIYANLFWSTWILDVLWTIISHEVKADLIQVISGSKKPDSNIDWIKSRFDSKNEWIKSGFQSCEKWIVKSANKIRYECLRMTPVPW